MYSQCCARRTLVASVGGAGDGASVFSGPEEKVWGAARHLTPECDGATLGGQDPLRINLHHQGGCSYKAQRS